GLDAFLPTDAWFGVRKGNSFQFRIGQMTSNWGLGLLANDGRAYLDQRQSDWFVRSETGDRVLRAMAIWRPLADSPSRLRGLVLSAAIDRVVADDILMRRDNQAQNFADLNQEEQAIQGILASRLYVSKKSWFGLYYVFRDQRHDDGKSLRVHTVDLAADLSGRLPFGHLRVRGETVFITGKTTLSPSPDHPEHEVRQAAIAAQGRLDISRLRLELDLAWFSGDNNFDDGYLTQFKADPNYQLGMLLFPRIMASWTGRARRTASNPAVVGKPNEDLERFATKGSVSSVMALFPKVGVRLPANVELYAGALIAIAPTPIADPFHTKTEGGGEAYNAMNQPAGNDYGIELDFGARWHTNIDPVHALTIGVEAGLLLPGSALAGLNDTIHGARLTLAVTPFGGRK
ncbi:MAG TPA: hypothetical protein DCQ06_04950, partial [Myxococcales bacterium]|nr:hypothetical protein [Myxococcales bacterium]